MTPTAGVRLPSDSDPFQRPRLEVFTEWALAERDAAHDPRPTADGIVKEGRSCVKGLLPEVPRQQHLNEPATLALVEALDVGEPVLVALARGRWSAPLPPEHYGIATQIYTWGAQVTIPAYRHRTRTNAEVTTALEALEFGKDKADPRKARGDSWIVAVRVAALNAVARGEVHLDALYALEGYLARQHWLDIWNARLARKVVCAPVPEDEHAEAVRIASALFREQRQAFVQSLRSVGVHPNDWDDVFQRALIKLERMPGFGPDKATKDYLRTAVSSAAADHMRELVRQDAAARAVAHESPKAGRGAAEPTNLWGDGPATDHAEPVDSVCEALDAIAALQASRAPDAPPVRIDGREAMTAASALAHTHVRAELDGRTGTVSQADLTELYAAYYRSTGRPAAARVQVEQRILELNAFLLLGAGH